MSPENNNKKEYAIIKAGREDLSRILEIMRPWNMHHYPSLEMEEIDPAHFFVARIGGEIVGAAGYKLLSQTMGKTTLMGVLPEYLGTGMGRDLQDARLRAMHRIGVKKVITNSDRPRVISWYIKHYGYVKIGTVKKLCSFGDPEVDHWTTLELDLEKYMLRADKKAAEEDHIARNEPHPLSPYPPFLINVCLSGFVPSKDVTEFVPVSEEEIIEDAVRAYDAGARVVHLHAFDKDGKPTWKASVYERILSGIRRERPDLICCVSCSGRYWSDFEKRTEALRISGPAKPDMASLTLGCVNFASGPSVNALDSIVRMAEIMKSAKIKPELEVFDLGMIGLASYLERKGHLTGRKYFNLMLGGLGQMPATIGNMAAMIKALPENSTWAAAGLGSFQLPMNTAAIVAGGGVRVGIEDYFYMDYARNRLATNEELVQRVVRIGAELERRVATPAEAVKLVGLEDTRAI